MKVKFILPYAGTENAPADYQPGDEAEIFDDVAYNLAAMGVVELVKDETPQPVKVKKGKG